MYIEDLPDTSLEAGAGSDASSGTDCNGLASASPETPRQSARLETAKVPPSSAGQRLSAKGKIWKLDAREEVSDELIEAAGGSLVIARLLSKRGITTVEAARAFLDPAAYTATPPGELPDVDKAVARINRAIQQKEQITVYGDYDVDGVTGTSVLLTVLRKLGAQVGFYIPNRASEGYGLNLKAVSILASKHRTKLIITCDCGVSNFAEINLAKSLGVDTLVLDHHSMPELMPPAVAIVHPKRLNEEHPLFHLPGVGVAYKVCEALLGEHGRAEEASDLIDFVTLGMIADLVPLIRENRYLVQKGLPFLIKSQRPGLQALLGQVKVSEDTDIVGFGLAPRINAAGRLSDANAAVELLTTDDREVAEVLARQLQNENVKRQELCDQIFFEADQMAQSHLAGASTDRAIVVYKQGWHHGVVGIVASRLVEKYHRPVFIGELEPEEGIVKGSARGVEGIDLYQVLKENDQLMLKFGGHKMAAGFSLESSKADSWSRALIGTCNRMLAQQQMQPVLKIDTRLEGPDLSLSLARQLMMLAPFGMDNKKPVFAIANVECVDSRPLGKEGKHAKVMLKDWQTKNVFECVMWSVQGNCPAEGEIIDLAFTPEINKYNGSERLQLVMTDWRSSNAAAGETSDAGANLDAEANRRAVAPAPLQQEFAQAQPDAVPVQAQAVPSHVQPGVVPMQAQPDAVPAQTLPNAVSGPAQPQAVHAAAEPHALPVKSEPVVPMTSRSFQSVSFSWKDMRPFAGNQDVLSKARAKLGTNLLVFSESNAHIEQEQFCDRLNVRQSQHLMFWEFPPTLQIFQEILQECGARTVYLVGGRSADEDAAGFLKKLLGLVKFAVNKKEGQVQGERLAVALSTNKMCVALGLTVLRKISVVDWFAEDGCIFLDIIGSPTGRPEQQAEYKQLSNAIGLINEFRNWCSASSLKEIQLAVAPNSIQMTQGLEDEALGQGGAVRLDAPRDIKEY